MYICLYLSVHLITTKYQWSEAIMQQTHYASLRMLPPLYTLNYPEAKPLWLTSWVTDTVETKYNMSPSS